MLPNRLLHRLATTLMLCSTAAASAAPILFATATPSSDSTFGHFVSLVASHQASLSVAPRGGDLWVRYDNGTLRNLTEEAGYGDDIVVREISVHWSAQKAVFAMAVGGTGANPTPVTFQLYEVTGFLVGETVQITKLPQPGGYNHIQPCYASDGSVIFGSDMPPTLNPLHYPPLDEYESTPTVAGLWKMKTDGTNLQLLDNNPSGDFTPFVDSYGRVIFTRWDHLKRDQQWDLWVDEQLRKQWTDAYNAANDPDIPTFTPSRSKTLTYDDENDTTGDDPAYGQEYFPENGRLHPDSQGNYSGSYQPTIGPHPYWDQDYTPGTEKQDFNFFTPWMVLQDGTEAELLNHLGRHEMFNYVPRSRTDLPHFSKGTPYSFNNAHQMREHPAIPGRYFGMDGAEFGYHGAGRLFHFDAPPELNADDIPATIQALTPSVNAEWAAGTSSDLYRDLMIRADGTFWAACAGTKDGATRTVNNPSSGDYTLSSNYQFKIRQLVPNGKGFYEAGPELVPGGITKTVSYVSNAFWPPRTVTYTGRMWELYPVEVVAKTAPEPFHVPIPTIEKNMLLSELGGEAGLEQLRQWMIDNNLALMVTRDVTVRADKQQEYNLKVAWSSHENRDPAETPAEVGYLQILNGQYVRSIAGRPGRRQLARYLTNLITPPGMPANAPVSSVKVADDGSVAAFVPAGRATTWQLTDPNGAPIVRERYWVTFQAGEVRACTNCHGVNKVDVFNKTAPTNQPEALTDLMTWWKATQSGGSSVKAWESYTSVMK